MERLDIALNDWVWPASSVPIWSKHALGKNYAAKIEPDDNAPDGFRRLWAPKARGIIGFVMRGFAVGDPIEVGSTDIDKERVVKRNRLYGVIRQIESTALVIRICPTIQEAVNLAGDATANLPTESGAAAFIQRQIRNLDEQQAKLTELRAELIGQLQMMVKSGLQGTGIELSDSEVEKITNEMATVLESNEIAPEDEKTLPLHRIMTTSSEPTNTPAPSRPQPTPAPLPARVASTSAADDEDEDEDDLTPAQKAILAKYVK